MIHDSFESINMQIAEIEEQLSLIEEQKAKYVLEPDIPLQLIREERKKRARLDDLRFRKKELENRFSQMEANQSNNLPELSKIAHQQLSTPELLKALENPDPLVCFPAAKSLIGRSDLTEELINISATTRVVEEAVRTVLGSFPEQSAQNLVAAIKNCGSTGETWHQARRASDYFSVVHSPYAADAIWALLQRSSIEVERHSLMALGNMGSSALGFSEVDQVLSDDYGYQKCFSYALRASAKNFVLAEDFSRINYNSGLLLHLIDMGEKRRSGVYASLPLGACSMRHVDKILTTWLDSDSKYVKKLGLEVLRRMRVARSASKVFKIWQKYRDDDVGEQALGTLWCIGEPNSIKALLQYRVDTIQGEGLMHIDEESFERFLPQVLDNPRIAWLAYRALGLRQRNDKLSLLRDGLFHETPAARASAALALARIGERNGIKRAYEESHDEDERILTALAALTAKIVEYATVEQQLRSDLAKSSFLYAIEAQEDIISTLHICGVEQAETLAQAWKPFYGRGDIEITISF